MKDFLTKNGAHWLPVIGRNLLEKLCVLHAKGYIFGDIKMENIIISEHGEVELIDYGGVTKKGRSVKQFTEIYDRGFWNAGSRTANSSYDLFAFAVLMLQAVEGPFHYDEARQMLHQNRSVVYLIELIRRSKGCKAFAPVLTQAVLGRYATPNQMIQDWHQITKAANSHNLTFIINRKLGIPILFIFSILLLWMVLSIFVR
jgi:serine/threonine protein kinase